MEPTNGTMGIVGSQPSRDRMRAADADRERVAERLRSAHADGRLDLTEYDERVQRAWAARTYGELDALTVDLPQTRPPTPEAGPEVRHLTNSAGRGTADVSWSAHGLLRV